MPDRLYGNRNLVESLEQSENDYFYEYGVVRLGDAKLCSYIL
jgi:hypothetical protein